MQSVTTVNTRPGAELLTLQATSTHLKPPRPWLQDFWLWILLVGPLVAPLFAALNLPILKPFADAIYLLGQTVCPKVSMHFMVFGFPMAVCSSCWSAVFGLWTVRLLYGRAGEGMRPFSSLGLAPFWTRWHSTAITTRLAVLAVGFFPWALDVMLWDLRLWASPHVFMMFAGYMGGLVAGAVLLPAAADMRVRSVKSRLG